jgi:hypothetical protein
MALVVSVPAPRILPADLSLLSAVEISTRLSATKQLYRADSSTGRAMTTQPLAAGTVMSHISLGPLAVVDITALTGHIRLSLVAADSRCSIPIQL